MKRPPFLCDPARRRLLLAAGGLFGLSLAGCSRRLLSAPRFSTDPFTLGVASGEPVSDGFVIWTRLAPDPLNGGGMPEAPVEVEWLVAADEKLSQVLRLGTAIAEPQWAHSVHVEVNGLEPGRWYWYQFRVGDALSPLGRSRTAPAAGAPLARLRLAFVSCQHYEYGYYAAYRHMAEDDLDLVLHLGDYIYESSTRDAVRRHGTGEPRTLSAYRNRHALYKTDRDLQRAHARFPWIVTWDDHDVENDYAGALSQDSEPPDQFLLRRAAAYQAYYEHLPLRLRSRPIGPDVLMYRSASFGDLLQIQVVDDRQYRSDQPCGGPGYGGGRVTADCAERTLPQRTMYGAAQERWLLQGLSESRARWNVIAQQLLMAQFDERPGPDRAWWTDGWDGYPAARARLLNHLHEQKIVNTVVLGGDTHSFFAADLKTDFDDPAAPTVAAEFTGTSITSHPGGSYDYFAAMLPDNPHIKYFESRYRGYARCEITPQLWRTDFRAVEDVRDPASAARTLQSFVVEQRRPGVQSA